jgi:alpha-beta hydrolase superfamily lysophospholipase
VTPPPPPAPIVGRTAGADGLSLATYRWEPPGDALVGRPTVLLAHGYAEHARRYAPLAGALTRAGYPVVAVDHRGHGASEGPRADVVAFGRYVDDFAAFAREAQPEAGRRVVFGHSMGGAIAALFAARHPDDLDALVLSSPYLRNAVPAPPWLERVARGLAWLAPNAPVRRLDAEALSRLPEEVEAYRADPAIYNGPAKARMARELLDGGRAALAAAAAIEVPVRIVHGDADRIADPAGAREIAARIGDRAEATIYDGGFHELLNDADRERVTADLVAWLERRYG